MNALKMKVTQEGEGLAITRTSANQHGENIVYAEKLNFDGKPSESTVFGTSKKKLTVAWSADGQQMTINSSIALERDGNTIDIKIVEVWKLIDGGKSLSVENTTTSPRGTSTNTFVYDKN